MGNGVKQIDREEQFRNNCEGKAMVRPQFCKKAVIIIYKYHSLRIIGTN